MGVLDGQSALVTGGGSGIGLACAAHLARDGAAVVLAGRTEGKLTAAADGLRAEGAREVHTVVCDVTDETSVQEACAAAAGVGRFTMVVANAGTGAASPIHLTSLDEWTSVLATNLTGAFLTIKHAATHLARSGGGSIVAVSSIAGPLTHRYMTSYCVSKAGLEMLVRNAADELGVAGIRANAVRPSLVPTDISVGLTSNPDIVADYLDQIPVGRLGTVDDIAAVVRFLLGPESGWVTGQCIGTDGGHTLRRGPNLTPLLEMVLGDNAHPH
ncbi:MAG TPA: SDR family oxidoreductase [Ilumatobacteraceae bacterium]|nr:SDR family oxidoreductase [Ilumatobacteraceae bacterium]